MDDFIILNGNDNVAVALRPMRADSGRIIY